MNKTLTQQEATMFIFLQLVATLIRVAISWVYVAVAAALTVQQ